MSKYLQILLSFIRGVRNAIRICKFRLRGVALHSSVALNKTTEIHPGGGRIVIGKNSSLSTGVILRAFGGSIQMGSNCTVNPYCVLDGGGGLVIGNGVRIAAHTVITPSNHNFADPNKFIYEQGLSGKGIVVEDDVWIGAGVQILDGVTIRKGTVVGAGAVVTKSTEVYSVIVGVPARRISMRK